MRSRGPSAPVATTYLQRSAASACRLRAGGAQLLRGRKRLREADYRAAKKWFVLAVGRIEVADHARKGELERFRSQRRFFEQCSSLANHPKPIEELSAAD